MWCSLFSPAAGAGSGSTLLNEEFTTASKTPVPTKDSASLIDYTPSPRKHTSIKNANYESTGERKLDKQSQTRANKYERKKWQQVLY